MKRNSLKLKEQKNEVAIPAELKQRISSGA